MDSSLPRATTTQEARQFRVQGVAMVLDQKGSGARVVARYPAAPTKHQQQYVNPQPRRPPRHGRVDNDDVNNSSNEDEDEDDDLFFTLPQKEMAKLFRTKRSMCGQPMTLSINNTIFCCRGVLMQQQPEETTTGTSNNASSTTDEETPGSSSSDQLVMFSVIVALSAPVNQQSVPFTSWLEGAASGDTQQEGDLQRYLQETASFTSPTVTNSKSKVTSSPSSSSTPPSTTPATTSTRVSSAFLAIRRIHISLARYCRILEREERRCQYISLQANQFFQLRKEQLKRWEDERALTRKGQPPIMSSSTTNKHSASSSLAPSTTTRKPRHSRTTSFGPDVVEATFLNQLDPLEEDDEDQWEREQDILDLLLSTSPPETPKGTPRHHGNLVHELTQIFHSLSRNDRDYPVTAEALLSERDGIVYVNQHVAIPIEAASLRPSQINTNQELALQPFCTLLFPHASPQELLAAFRTSGSPPPHKLQKLLLAVNSQVAFTDIAVEANLPLCTTMELASYLLKHDACVLSPVVDRQSRLSCQHISRIQSNSLEFSQTYPGVHLFRLVSYLTSVATLGEAMSSLTDFSDRKGHWLRKLLLPKELLVSQGQPVDSILDESSIERGMNVSSHQTGEKPRWCSEAEEDLYGMTIWLLSHQILVQMQDFLVQTTAETPSSSCFDGRLPGRKSTPNDSDAALFQELSHSNLLTGDQSILSLAWTLGMEPKKLRAWGNRHPRIRIYTRLPTQQREEALESKLI